MKTVKIFLIALAALFVLSLMKNGIVQAMIEKAVSSAAHVPVHIGKTSAKILSTSIRLERLRVENPRGFHEKTMLSAPLISVDYDLPPLFKGQVYFKEVDLDLEELIVIKNAEGKLNIDAVKPSKEETAKRKEKEKEAQEKKKPLKLQIDRLKLSIGRVAYKDYSGGRKEPAVQIFDINMRDKVFTDIHEPGAVVSVVMFEALTRTTLSRILGLDTSMFKEGALDTLSKSFDLVSGGSDKLEEATKGIFGLFDNQ